MDKNATFYNPSDDEEMMASNIESTPPKQSKENKTLDLKLKANYSAYIPSLQKQTTHEYIKGYTEVIDTDINIAAAAKSGTEDYYKATQNIIEAKRPDTLDQSMPSDNENAFKYEIIKNPASFFDDPTYLSYELIIMADSSPLLNYGSPDSEPKKNTALRFITRYKRITEIGSREQVYSEFRNRLSDYFSIRFQSNVIKPKHAFYIENIAGLDKLTKKITEYEKDLLTITLTEDITMRSQYLADLYNDLIYSYRNGRYLIPENCLKFDLIVKITDVRTFKLPNPNYDPSQPISRTNTIEINNDTPSVLMYKLHDCNFNFFESKIHEDAIPISVGTTGAKMVFTIKYKAVSKITSASMLANSSLLNNKAVNVVGAKTTFNPSIDYIPNEEIADNKEKKKARDKGLGVLGVDKFQNTVKDPLNKPGKKRGKLLTSEGKLDLENYSKTLTENFS